MITKIIMYEWFNSEISLLSNIFFSFVWKTTYEDRIIISWRNSIGKINIRMCANEVVAEKLAVPDSLATLWEQPCWCLCVSPCLLKRDCRVDAWKTITLYILFSVVSLHHICLSAPLTLSSLPHINRTLPMYSYYWRWFEVDGYKIPSRTEGCSPPTHDPQLRCNFVKCGNLCCIFDTTRRLSRFDTSAD